TPNLGQKLLTGAIRTGADAGTNPLTYLPVGRIAQAAHDAIPGVAPATKAIAGAVASSPLGKLLNPDNYLQGLTDEGRALYESITHKAMQAVRGQKQTEDAIVKQYAPQIRAGQMPPEVAALFNGDNSMLDQEAWRKYFPD